MHWWEFLQFKWILTFMIFFIKDLSNNMKSSSDNQCNKVGILRKFHLLKMASNSIKVLDSHQLLWTFSNYKVKAEKMQQFNKELFITVHITWIQIITTKKWCGHLWIPARVDNQHQRHNRHSYRTILYSITK